jgi:hypothetical protein
MPRFVVAYISFFDNNIELKTIYTNETDEFVALKNYCKVAGIDVPEDISSFEDLRKFFFDMGSTIGIIRVD